MILYKVLNNDLTSPFQGFQFEINKKYLCEDFDDSDTECSTGFYATNFNGLVYSLNKDGDKHSVFEVEVGGKSKEFNQFKRRFEKMTILRHLSKEEIKAGLLACEEQEGYKVLEACYPVDPFTIEPIALEEALVLLEQWKKVWDSVGDLVWHLVGHSVGDSVGYSVWNSVWDSVWDSVGASVGHSIWDLVGHSVWASVWGSVGAYTSSLFPNIREWKYTNHTEWVNPFQSGAYLWKGGYVPSFGEDIWRLHTKKGIAWEGE